MLFRSLALRLGGERLFRCLREESVDALARSAGTDWAKDEIFGGIRRACNAWPEVARTAPARMREALLQHWEEVPVLAKMGRFPA